MVPGFPRSTSHRARGAALIAAVVVAVVMLPTAPAAQLYRWTDAGGVTHYTSDPASIPPPFRARAQEVGAPQARPPEAAPSLGSTVIPYAAGAPVLAAAAINGVPLRLIVDTGAERTLVSPQALARAGVPLENARPVRIVGVTGAAGAREVSVPRLDVAGTQVGPLPIIVHDGGFPNADGLLGRDVLDAFTLTVDPAAGRAILQPR
jgi:hypothetical protein